MLYSQTASDFGCVVNLLKAPEQQIETWRNTILELLQKSGSSVNVVDLVF